MISPFEGLSIDPRLACEFFATFARFEYALKATPPFCRCDRGRAAPDWTFFREKVGADLMVCRDQEIVDTIRYLVNNPPEVQRYEDGRAVFRPDVLQGTNDAAKAIEAARRVRNNLFHGGKHTPHSPPARDERLIRSSLIILEACLKLRPDLCREFDA